ncbi:YfiR family protein [Piscinibacter aquaticus]|uniref:YfiR family protein n=1 Tax=Piscinibacter aquaticus TaxID=392597 RepID=A0A5C6U157_9BURK|nr:YfiR family protein [Piscinibacter aquaticus]
MPVRPPRSRWAAPTCCARRWWSSRPTSAWPARRWCRDACSCAGASRSERAPPCSCDEPSRPVPPRARGCAAAGRGCAVARAAARRRRARAEGCVRLPHRAVRRVAGRQPAARCAGAAVRAGQRSGRLAAFETLDGKKVQGRALAPVRAVGRGDDLRACHALFVPQRELRKPLPVLPGLLTVGEAEGFAESGGVVGFVRQGAQLRFDINRDVAAQAQLRLSAELLKVARSVVDSGGTR